MDSNDKLPKLYGGLLESFPSILTIALIRSDWINNIFSITKSLLVSYRINSASGNTSTEFLFLELSDLESD